MVELDDLSFFSFKWFKDEKQHLDVEHFFHTFPGIFCFLTNPCLVQMIRLLGAIFQGQPGCYFQGVGPPLNLGSLPGLELAPQRSHKVGWTVFGSTFCGGKFWKVTKNNLFFWADPEKKRKTTFFLMVGSVFFQSKWSWFLPVGRNSINYKPVERDGMMWVVPPPSDSQDCWKYLKCLTNWWWNDTQPLSHRLPSRFKKNGDGKMEKMGSGEFFQHLTDRKVSQVRIFQSFRDWKQNKNIKSREFQPHQS